VSKCNNQHLSTSIRWVIETMGEGGDMTIIGVEGRRSKVDGENNEVEDATIVSLSRSVQSPRPRRDRR
jgi:hypothetical protein